MTHELTMVNGKAEMAYAGETPWHGLGQELTAGAPIEEWIVAAGMEWRILRSRVRYAVAKDTAADQATWRTMDDRCVLLRSDNGNALGIVSDGYQPVQPASVVEFFRDLTDSVGFVLETAGTLFGGRRFWALAKTNAESIVIDKRDKVKAHLLLATSSDGSMATEASYVATRVVCNNTLRMANAEAGKLKVRVNHKSTFDPSAVKGELGIEAAMSAFDRTVARMRQMAETRMTEESVILATCGLLHPNYAAIDDQAKRDKIIRSKPVEAIARLVLNNAAIGADMDGVSGTAYGWLNGVTEYVDHAARAQTTDNRLDSAWFGRGADVKERAFEIAGAVTDHVRANGGAASASSAVTSVNTWLEDHGGLLDSVIDATPQGK